MGTLLTAIVTDLEELVRQELALASRAIRAEDTDAAASVLGLAVGGVTIALGVVLVSAGGSLALAYWLDWPTWLGFGAVGAGLAVIGTGLFVYYSRRVSTLRNRPW